MKLYTHTDMDGVISAVLLKNIYDIDIIEYTEPYMIQRGIVKPSHTDIVADLPNGHSWHWYDHHPNQTDFEGNMGIYNPDAKSCARIIYNKYKDKLSKFEDIVNKTDIIDSADYTKDDILNPNSLNKLAIAIRSGDMVSDNSFREYLIDALSIKTPKQVMEDWYPKKRVEDKLKKWKMQQKEAEKNMVFFNDITVMNFLKYENNYPIFQLFNIYIKYPKIMFIITVRKDKDDTAKISVGRNIFEKNSFEGHIGLIMKKYGGGGHKGIGGCNVKFSNYKQTIKNIMKQLRG